MVDTVRFEIKSNAEIVDDHRLYLHGVKPDSQFIAELRRLDPVEHTTEFTSDGESYIALFMLWPCYAVELTPMIAPLVEQLVARQNAAYAS